MRLSERFLAASPSRKEGHLLDFRESISERFPGRADQSVVSTPRTEKRGHLLDFRESISERFPAAFHLI